MRLPAGGRVQGALVGPDGSGLAGHGLILEPGLYKITTSNDGTYVLGYVRAGTYRVFVRSGSGRVPAGTIKVDPGATQQRVIRLTGTGSVLGRVAPAPVHGKGHATFRRSGEVAGEAVVDVHGAFRLEYLEPGEYELAVDIDQTRVEKSRVVVRAGEVTDAGVISSGSLPQIPIAVRVPTGTTIPRHVVITIALTGRTIREDVLLDEKGRGVLSRVPVGKHSGRIEARGFRAVETVSCEVIEGTGPGQPGGKKGFKINKATFAGTARINGVKGFPIEGFVIDRGEPSGKKNNQKDFFEIVARDPDTNAIVFEASGELDGGNVQLHPPTGRG